MCSSGNFPSPFRFYEFPPLLRLRHFQEIIHVQCQSTHTYTHKYLNEGENCDKFRNRALRIFRSWKIPYLRSKNKTPSPSRSPPLHINNWFILVLFLIDWGFFFSPTIKKGWKNFPSFFPLNHVAEAFLSFFWVKLSIRIILWKVYFTKVCIPRPERGLLWKGV